MSQLSTDTIFIVANYFTSSKDYVTLERVCKRYRNLSYRFDSNPISINSPVCFKLFPHIHTLNFYKKSDLMYYTQYNEENTLSYSVNTLCFKYEMSYSDVVKINGIQTIFKSLSISKKERLKTKNRIPPEVNILASSAFEKCTTLKDFVVPDNVRVIKSSCFDSCSNLSTIKLPIGLTRLGTSCFSGARKLESIEIPKLVQAIGYNTFKTCEALSKVFLHDEVTSLGRSVFFKCSSLAQIDLPNKLRDIGIDCFNECGALKEIVLPEHVKEIPEEVFQKLLETLICLSSKEHREGRDVCFHKNTFKDVKSVHFVVAKTNTKLVNHLQQFDCEIGDIRSVIQSVCTKIQKCRSITHFERERIDDMSEVQKSQIEEMEVEGANEERSALMTNEIAITQQKSDKKELSGNEKLNDGNTSPHIKMNDEKSRSREIKATSQDSMSPKSKKKNLNVKAKGKEVKEIKKNLMTKKESVLKSKKSVKNMEKANAMGERSNGESKSASSMDGDVNKTIRKLYIIKKPIKIDPILKPSELKRVVMETLEREGEIQKEKKTEVPTKTSLEIHSRFAGNKTVDVPQKEMTNEVVKKTSVQQKGTSKIVESEIPNPVKSTCEKIEGNEKVFEPQKVEKIEEEKKTNQSDIFDDKKKKEEHPTTSLNNCNTNENNKEQKDVCNTKEIIHEMFITEKTLEITPIIPIINENKESPLIENACLIGLDLNESTSEEEEN
ncbi:hypothetical protein EIN_133420 [Entamoeba invadens IP1]|uniref:Leucine rich repeat containing protein BspA family protein n=1 Tax=Entamoeba invadens IP1 TaxID=370355 RepID=L7FLC7_ENTIV|nr:hypothetical protein EIN_133420 [Entamoeba invadens IP1]ELP86663.1 hypothetical protein EIN_133420 [Entamoeba invadens IP1]|eukprot:XP_004186009.1 hypothetical protein EIN_133420 [Entamoeba invadens IP1]